MKTSFDSESKVVVEKDLDLLKVTEMFQERSLRHEPRTSRMLDEKFTIKAERETP